MKKLLSIAVVVALMVCFPIVAGAKDKAKKNVEQYNYGKALVTLQERVAKAKENYKNPKNPFLALQEQIDGLEETVYGVAPGSGLQEQINAIWMAIDAIEEQLGSSGASGSYYTVIGDTIEVSLTSEIFEVETVCNPIISGQKVMSGGYDLRLLENEFDIPVQYPFYTVHIIGQGPNNAGDGWKVRVVNSSGLGATLQVQAVCFGQPPSE